MQIIEPSYITDARLISSDIVEASDYEEWSAYTLYPTGQRVTVNDVARGIHKIYECIWPNDNLNKYPPDYLVGDPAYWMLIGATNLWRLFDMIVAPDRTNVPANVTGTKWAAGNAWPTGTVWDQGGYASLMLTIEPGQIDTVALLNCDSTSITLIMDDPTEGIVYNEEKIPALTEAYNAVYSDLPAYPNAQLIVIVRNTGGDINIGEIVCGSARTIGKVKYGVNIGLTDFSTKDTDDFGNFILSEKAFSKRVDCSFFMPTAQHSGILRLLERYRSVPLVWILSELYSTLIIYGFYRDLDVNITSISITDATVSIEGLGADLVNANPPEGEWEAPWSGMLELTGFGMASIATPTLSAIAATPVLISSIATLTAFGMATIATPTLKVHTNRGTCTISNAEPCVVTLNAHGLVEDQEVFFTTTGAVPSPLIADRIYYCANPATNTFNISLTIAGSTIDTTNDGSGVHTLYAEVL